MARDERKPTGKAIDPVRIGFSSQHIMPELKLLEIRLDFLSVSLLQLFGIGVGTAS